MNEGDISTHTKQIEDLFNLLKEKADKADLDKLAQELQKLLKQIENLKETFNKYKEKFEKPDLTENILKQIADLEKKIHDFQIKTKEKQA